MELDEDYTKIERDEQVAQRQRIESEQEWRRKTVGMKVYR
jgi:hypothetical protein